jgi:hypothetical protein
VCLRCKGLIFVSKQPLGLKWPERKTDLSLYLVLKLKSSGAIPTYLQIKLLQYLIKATQCLSIHAISDYGLFRYDVV